MYTFEEIKTRLQGRNMAEVGRAINKTQAEVRMLMNGKESNQSIYVSRSLAVQL